MDKCGRDRKVKLTMVQGKRVSKTTCLALLISSSVHIQEIMLTPIRKTPSEHVGHEWKLRRLKVHTAKKRQEEMEWRWVKRSENFP